MNPIDSISGVVQELYGIVTRLEQAYPTRKFTLDGHLVGSIGEVLAREIYALSLLPSSTATHDARDDDGRLVQIKATQGKGVSLNSQPDYLIALFVDRTGLPTEIFNGPGEPVWAKCGKMQKNGQRRIALSRLRELNEHVSPEQRIRKRTAIAN